MAEKSAVMALILKGYTSCKSSLFAQKVYCSAWRQWTVCSGAACPASSPHIKSVILHPGPGLPVHICLWGEKWTQCPVGGSCLPSQGPPWRGWLTFTVRRLNKLNGPTSHNLLCHQPLTSPTIKTSPSARENSVAAEWKRLFLRWNNCSQHYSTAAICCGKAFTCFHVVKSVNNKMPVCHLWGKPGNLTHQWAWAQNQHFTDADVCFYWRAI